MSISGPMWRVSAALATLGLGTLSLELAHATDPSGSYRTRAVWLVVIVGAILIVPDARRFAAKVVSATHVAWGLLALGLLFRAAGGLARTANLTFAPWVREGLALGGVAGEGGAICLALTLTNAIADRRRSASGNPGETKNTE